jgi:hypothetical protein
VLIVASFQHTDGMICAETTIEALLSRAGIEKQKTLDFMKKNTDMEDLAAFLDATEERQEEVKRGYPFICQLILAACLEAKYKQLELQLHEEVQVIRKMYPLEQIVLQGAKTITTTDNTLNRDEKLHGVGTKFFKRINELLDERDKSKSFRRTNNIRKNTGT